MKRVGFVLTLAGLASIAQAAEWTNEIELGAVVTTGNTEEQNLKLRVDSVRELDQWRHHVHLDNLRSSKDNETTAQKLYAFYQADYKLDEDRSVFGRVAYDDDRFSGFNYQADITAGYSQTIFANTTMRLSGDAGVGMRLTEVTTGDRDEEGILRLAGKYVWEVSDNASFQQLLSTEIGNDSTISRSDTSIKANINGSLSMKLALVVKHNSAVPVDRKATDTETSVTLVYGF